MKALRDRTGIYIRGQFCAGLLAFWLGLAMQTAAAEPIRGALINSPLQTNSPPTNAAAVPPANPTPLRKDPILISVAQLGVSAAGGPKAGSDAAPSPGTDTPHDWILSDRKKYLVVSFAELSSFPFRFTQEMAQKRQTATNALDGIRQQVPDAIKALNGKDVAVTGFMLPVRVEGGLATHFLLLKNQMACCYGIPPKKNEWVVVRSVGKGVKPLMDVPLTVAGRFHIAELREAGNFIGLYLLDGERVLDAKETVKN
jgi:hypothetical protein